MSRSHRNTPIFGITTCESERRDKQAWHRRLRRKERAALIGMSNAQSNVSADALEGHFPLTKHDVSSLWEMGKDGRQWWPVSDQAERAEHAANWRGRNPQERAALKSRFLRQWMSK